MVIKKTNKYNCCNEHDNNTDLCLRSYNLK